MDQCWKVLRITCSGSWIVPFNHKQKREKDKINKILGYIYDLFVRTFYEYRDKTMTDKFMYFLNDNKQNYPSVDYN